MNLKFLPIGTVCLVKNVNKKQMIIGYSKSGYDYVAVSYPKGFESDNKLSYFNHDQVYELYSLGYKNEESRIFNGTLVSVQTTYQEEEEDYIPTSSEVGVDKNEDSIPSISVEEIPTIANTFQFDENGIVVSDGNEDSSSNGETTITQVSESDVPNFNKEEEEVSKPVENSLQFDENGIVVSDGTEMRNESTLEQKSMNITTNSVEPISSKSVENHLKFDENGIVISDGTEIADSSNDSVGLDEIAKESKEELPFINSEATIDVSDVVKQIEKTITEAETSEEEGSEEPSGSPKKEKRGLFHFGRK